MIPDKFEYFAPTSVTEVIELLQQHGDEAKIIAGGHSLLPTMKLRLAAPSVLIDIGKVDALREISVNGNVRIGAATTYNTIMSSEEVTAACPVLGELLDWVGDIQVRNRGTLGGSLAHADPAADPPAVMLALEGQITAQGPNGTRTIAAGDFFVDMLTTALEPDEVLTRIELPSLGAGEAAAYVKYPHPASRYAVVGVAAYIKMDGGNITTARIGVTGAGPKAERQPGVETALTGTDGSAAAIAAAADHSGKDMDVLGDIHASETYRRAMVKVYTQRALSLAVDRARS